MMNNDEKKKNKRKVILLGSLLGFSIVTIAGVGSFALNDIVKNIALNQDLNESPEIPKPNLKRQPFQNDLSQMCVIDGDGSRIALSDEANDISHGQARFDSNAEHQCYVLPQQLKTTQEKPSSLANKDTPDSRSGEEADSPEKQTPSSEVTANVAQNTPSESQELAQNSLNSSATKTASKQSTRAGGSLAGLGAAGASTGNGPQSQTGESSEEEQSPGLEQQEQASSSDSETPTTGNDSETPTTGNDTETPTTGNDSETPTTGNDTETPTTGNDTETPSTGNDTETPTTGNDTETPTTGNDTETPTTGNDTETPSPGDNTEPQTNDSQSNDIEDEKQAGASKRGTLINTPLFLNGSDQDSDISNETPTTVILERQDLINNGSIEILENELLVITGNLSGSGSFVGDVLLSGASVNPGNSPGLLNFSNDLIIDGTNSDLLIEFTGTQTRGVDFDAIDVLGNIQFISGLNISAAILSSISMSDLLGLEFEILRVGGSVLDDQGASLELNDFSFLPISIQTGWGFRWFEQATSGWGLSIFMENDNRNAQVSDVPEPGTILFAVACFIFLMVQRYRKFGLREPD